MQSGTFVKIKYTKLFTPESSICQSLYRKNSPSSHRCHFIKNYFFPNQAPSCICSMCLYCKGNISNCSIKNCGRSWSAHEGTINAYTKALLEENCLSSNSCHLVSNYYFQIKLLHAYVQYVYIVVAKHQIAPSKAVVGVDRPIKALSMQYTKVI